MAEKKQQRSISFIAAGDVFLSGKVVYQDGSFKEVLTSRPESVFEGVAPVLHEADIIFCNLETSLSDRGSPQRGRATALISRPENIHVLKNAGVSIVSLANNHSMDFGSEAMLHSLELLDDYGIAHAGAGENIMAARAPAFIEKNGITLAFIAYTTNNNIPRRCFAGPQTPGLAPIRISPYFEPPHVNKEDLKAMELDIQNAKSKADFVIVSCHWGVYNGGTHTIAVHQKGIGHAAINAGADIILGHHQHVYQGIELYRNKIICHGLGNFIFDTISTLHPPDMILFQCAFQKKTIKEAWLLPISRDGRAHPYILSPEDKNSKRILAHIHQLSKEFKVKLRIKNNRGIISRS